MDKFPKLDSAGLMADMGAPTMTPAQQAYGLLWHDTTASPLVHRARKLLLASLTKDEQREAIEWATREVGSVRPLKFCK